LLRIIDFVTSQGYQIVNIDFHSFKIYNKSQGEDTGDNCLEKIRASLGQKNYENFIALVGTRCRLQEECFKCSTLDMTRIGRETICTPEQ
jgi:PleD family two-component response regulator